MCDAEGDRVVISLKDVKDVITAARVLLVQPEGDDVEAPGQIKIVERRT